MDTFLAVIGSLIAASGTVPYIVATVQGKTKPRVVTWFIWATLTGLASAAAFSDGQVGAGIFALLGALATGSVVIAGLAYGDRQLTTLDVMCLAGAAYGLALWLMSDSPAIIIDFVGLIPTYKHAWVKPREETLSTYVLVGIGGLLTVAAVAGGGQISVTAIGYPLYAALSLGAVAAIIYLRQPRRRDG